MMKQNKEIPQGYKDSPLGVIPEDWEVKRLGDFCPVFKSGEGITAKNIHEQGAYPVYGGNGLRGYTNSYTHNGAYVIIGRQGALCGNVNYVKGLNYISEHGIAVQTNTKNNLLFWYFNLNFLNLNRFSESSAQPGLSVEKLLRHKVALPPLPEQQKIAEILSCWDAAIEKQSQLIEKLETRKRGLMQQLLTGKKRLKGFEGDTLFKQLKPYIKELSIRNKKPVTTILSVTNQKGFIEQKEQFDRVVASEDLSNYKVIQRGQFAYNPSRVNVGSLDLLSTFDIGVLSPMYIVFETNETELLSSFLYYQLKTFWFTGHIPMFVQGSVRDSLSFDGLCAMKFFIPLIAEQTAIANVLSTVDEEVNKEKEKLAALKSQKKGLMQVLLTGKKRVKI